MFLAHLVWLDPDPCRFVRVIGRGGFGIVKMVRAKKTGVRPHLIDFSLVNRAE